LQQHRCMPPVGSKACPELSMRLWKYPMSQEKRSGGPTGSSPVSLAKKSSRHHPSITFRVSAPGSRSKEKCRAVRSRFSERLGNASSQVAGARPGLQRLQFTCLQSLVENGAPSAKWQKLPVSRSYPHEQVQGTGRETRY